MTRLAWAPPLRSKSALVQEVLRRVRTDTRRDAQDAPRILISQASELMSSVPLYCAKQWMARWRSSSVPAAASVVRVLKDARVGAEQEDIVRGPSPPPPFQLGWEKHGCPYKNCVLFVSKK